MSKETRGNIVKVLLILLAAASTVGATRIIMPLDQIRCNEKANIEQAKDIEAIQKDNERIYETLIRLEGKIDQIIQTK